MVSQDPRTRDAAPDERVALLLAAAAAPAEPGPQPGEEQALAAFRASPHPTRRFSMFSTPSRAKIAVASTLGAGAFLFAGVGAAAAGVLPDTAQDTASSWLATLGIEVPNAHAGDHPTAGDSADDATETDGTEATETEEADESDADVATEADDAAEAGTEAESEGKGGDVSGLATSTTAEGVDKGAEISTLASGGKSRAGADHTPPAAAEDTADAEDSTGSDQAPVEHPNSGGTGTAGAATAKSGDGASASGTGTADEASSGHSASGSQNRP